MKKTLSENIPWFTKSFLKKEWMDKLTRKETGLRQGWRENDKTTEQKRVTVWKRLTRREDGWTRMQKDLPKEGNWRTCKNWIEGKDWQRWIEDRLTWRREELAEAHYSRKENRLARHKKSRWIYKDLCTWRRDVHPHHRRAADSRLGAPAAGQTKHSAEQGKEPYQSIRRYCMCMNNEKNTTRQLLKDSVI